MIELVLVVEEASEQGVSKYCSPNLAVEDLVVNLVGIQRPQGFQDGFETLSMLDRQQPRHVLQYENGGLPFSYIPVDVLENRPSASDVTESQASTTHGEGLAWKSSNVDVHTRSCRNPPRPDIAEQNSGLAICTNSFPCVGVDLGCK